MEENKMESARDFAIAAHGDQKYGEHPYVKHLDDVAGVVTKHHGSATIVAAAYLHDVLEDTSVTHAALDAAFGENVTKLVAAVTKLPGLSRRLNLEPSMHKIRTSGPDAVFLKLCDRIANVSASSLDPDASMFKMYKREHYTMKRLLLIEGEHDALWDELDALFDE